MSDKFDDIYKELVVKGNEATKPKKASEYVFEFDLKGNFLSVSQEAADFSGYSLKDIETMSVWDVISEKDHDLMLENFAARKEGRPVDPYEVTLMTKSGNAIRIKVETTPIVEDGKVSRVRGKFIPLD
jgi:PAS domain S-box-containing protein